MKKYLIIGGVTILLALIAFWIMRQANIIAYKDMVLAILPHDIASFHDTHKRLPLSWDEFATWSGGEHTSKRWNASELDSLFALKWGVHVNPNDSRDEKIFFVLEPKLKDIEPYLNQRLHDFCNIPNSNDNPSPPIR